MAEPSRDEPTPDSLNFGGGRSVANGADAEAALKSLAKAVAKDTAAQIPDRHLRAQVRTSCYNQMVNVLRILDGRLAAQRLRHRRTAMVLGSVAAVLAIALAVSLLGH